MEWDRRKAANEEKDKWAAPRLPVLEGSVFVRNAVISFLMSLGNRAMREIALSAGPK